MADSSPETMVTRLRSRRLRDATIIGIVGVTLLVASAPSAPPTPPVLPGADAGPSAVAPSGGSSS